MTSSRSCKPWGRATWRSAIQGWSLLHGKIWLSTERLKKMMRNSTLICPDVGWQQKAAECVDAPFVATNVWPILTNQEKALMRSQTGPLSSLPFTVLPTNRFSRFDPQPFRVLLLRRLHLPLSLTARQCRCGRPACGHHRSACAVAGVLGRRGYPLETAAVEKQELVCVSTPWSGDLDLLPGALLDNRRLEVVADGLPLFNGAQLAIDTTMV